ncbi:WYL domain-containing protein [Phototrophicus methaneseepsis]|uniref:WYL domain-containing protein n=1 Tax=Phototrophicus methaneseepsis TaxID=2710758 RepID=A0A7S8ICX0_9CHLR|nr:WYL domain-containing protein [Phototrophicus methaneseepsis]QPC80926.1 WYL domain-containing protein [Phototrophicus methaneseepsis]
MIPLLVVLSSRTYRDLRVVAGAHRLRFNNKIPKQATIARLSMTLATDEMHRAFRQLSEKERLALQALQAHEGKMPLYRFVRAFGSIRPYKPWRIDAIPHPWRRPISVAERLYQLAFIHIEGQQVVLVDEVQALLPPLPRPKPIHSASDLPLSSVRDALLTDISALLGTLTYKPIRPQWHRWLPPYALKAINERLYIKEDCTEIRSEMQTNRLRWLHYLAQSAGLMSIQGGHFLPTTRAWSWLNQPAEERWHVLFEAIDPTHTLWHEFRLPDIEPALWRVLKHQLSRLEPEKSYHIRELVAAMRPYLPEMRRVGGQTRYLLETALTWMGYVQVDGLHFSLTSSAQADIEPLQIDTWNNAYYLEPVRRSHPAAWAELLSFARPENGALCIDEAAVRHAIGSGYQADDVMRILASLTGAPLALTIAQQIESWAQNARSLQIKHMVVLQSSDKEALQAIRTDWRLRPYIEESLSPHHLAIRSEHWHTLRQRLANRGYYPLTSGSIPQKRRVSDHLSNDMREYLWLAARVYQRMSTFSELPIAMPGALLDWLADDIDPTTLHGLQTQVDAVIDNVRERIAGFDRRGYVTQNNSQSIQLAIHAAYDQQTSVEITYHSPYRGETTIRRIEPTMIYSNNGATYIEAWCHLEHATRTFRMDRILQVHNMPQTKIQVQAS